jgi:hypothetical protein
MDFGNKGTYLDLKEVFWRTVYLLKALLACIWHGLHNCGGKVYRRECFSGWLARLQDLWDYVLQLNNLT